MSNIRPQYANVAPAMPLPAAGRQVFTYRLAPGQHPAGHGIVQIPVGRRTLTGVIINTHTQKPSYPTKGIKRLYNAALTPQQHQFAQQIALLSHGSLGYTARLFFPPSLASGMPPLSTTGEREGVRSTKNNQDVSISYKLSASWRTTSCLTAPPEQRLPELLKIVDHVLKNDQQALLLVPEIWMTDQLQRELLQSKHLTKDHLFLYSGDRKNSELTAVWNAIGQGQSGIVIGTQKALFLPWQSLSHIIIEEEAFDTHKLWDQYPRLDNRLAARHLAHLHQAHLTLTNTYPSLTVEHLKSIKGAPPLPASGEREGVRGTKSNQIVPKSYKLKAKSLALHPRLTPYSHQDRRSRRLLPQEFLPRLRTWYKDGDKVLILLQRRQEAEVTTKPGWQTNITGLADILQKLRFPAKKILWLDASAAAKQSPEKTQKQIDQARIVIATSAIFTHAVGHQFGRAVWLFPEQTINYPDYRSVERARLTLARLQQQLPPRRSVDLLSRQPRLIEDHLLADHESYVSHELKLRKMYHYPPYTDIVKLTVQAKTQKEADAKATKLRKQIEGQKEELSPSFEGEPEGVSKTTNYQLPPTTSNKILIRGPYKDLKKPQKNQERNAHLLLQGPLDQLVKLYEKSPTDQADPYPHQVL